jgi:hypothetical protein
VLDAFAADQASMCVALSSAGHNFDGDRLSIGDLYLVTAPQGANEIARLGRSTDPGREAQRLHGREYLRASRGEIHELRRAPFQHASMVEERRPFELSNIRTPQSAKSILLSVPRSHAVRFLDSGASAICS